GAAQSLNGSLIVNPWNTEELANAIHDAVTMSPEQREANFRKLERYVFKYTSAWWGQSFVAELNRISAGEDAGGSGGKTESAKLAIRSAAEGVADAVHKVAQGAQEAVAGAAASGEEKKEEGEEKQ